MVSTWVGDNMGKGIMYKIDGVWHKVAQPFYKIDGVWHKPVQVWYKIDGVWHSTWVSGVQFGDWSQWYDYEIKPIEGQREVRSENQYRCQNYGNFAYNETSARRACWDKDPNSAGDRCSKCKIPSQNSGEFAHYRGSWWRPQWNAYECISTKQISKNGWGYDGLIDNKSGWMSGDGGSNTGSYRVTDRRTAWSYRDKL